MDDAAERICLPRLPAFKENTFCVDQADTDTAEYVRADLHQKALDRIEELEAENKRLRGAVAEAIYLLDPEAEDVLKGAGIYRIVLAHEQAGGVLPDDLKYALQEVKEKSVTKGTYDG